MIHQSAKPQILCIMSDSKTLDQLQGAEDKGKTIKPEDRKALNEALFDQSTIDQMDRSGKSSQEKRKEIKRERDSREHQQSSAAGVASTHLP
jgi:hypothetical protein